MLSYCRLLCGILPVVVCGEEFQPGHPFHSGSDPSSLDSLWRCTKNSSSRADANRGPADSSFIRSFSLAAFIQSYGVSDVMNETILRFETKDRVGEITLNHPERRNALSRQMLETLRARLLALRADTGVKVLVISSTGPVFSSGHDLRELESASSEEAESLFALCSETMELLQQIPQPVIASVGGLATAAGCQLATSCDLIVASENAAFATPGVKIGVFCSTPAVPLSRALPTKKALEMLFTGQPLSATDAERYGMVNRVVPLERLSEETWNLAGQIATAASSTLALGKRAFYEQLPLSRSAAYEKASQSMVDNVKLPDAREGIHAFLTKRTPAWQD